MEQAIGIYCPTLSEVDKKISPETILKFYQQVASSFVNQSISLPIPAERFGWVFLFDVRAFGATKRQKIMTEMTGRTAKVDLNIKMFQLA